MFYTFLAILRYVCHLPLWSVIRTNLIVRKDHEQSSHYKLIPDLQEKNTLVTTFKTLSYKIKKMDIARSFSVIFISVYLNHE